MKNIEYDYYSFLNDDDNTKELYTPIRIVETLYADGHFMSMANACRHFFECLLWMSCETLNIKPEYHTDNPKADQWMSIGKTAFLVFDYTKNLNNKIQNLYHNKIRNFIELIQSGSHYEQIELSTNINLERYYNTEQLLECINLLVKWYVIFCLQKKISFPDYDSQKLKIYKNEEDVTIFKNEIQSLKNKIIILQNGNTQLTDKYNKLSVKYESKSLACDQLKTRINTLENESKVKNSVVRVVTEHPNYNNLQNKFYDYKMKSSAEIRGYKATIDGLKEENDELKEKNKQYYNEAKKYKELYLDQCSSKEKSTPAEVKEKTKHNEQIYSQKEDTNVIVSLSLKDDIKNTILLFHQLGCWITKNTIYKYLIGVTADYTRRYNLKNTDAFGKYANSNIYQQDMDEIIDKLVELKFIVQNPELDKSKFYLLNLKK